MFKTLKNAWKTPELQKKMIFTLFIVLLYRLGACIIVPYVDGNISTLFQQQYGDSIFGLLGVLSGGAMQTATLFALSVSPYITASIVIQLLTIAIPALERMAKDGANGQKKINTITRFLTVGLAVVTSFGYSLILKNGNGSQSWLIPSIGTEKGVPEWFALLVINACFCAGASLVMWLAELINEKGIGNGISVILCVNIIASFPSFFTTLLNGITNGTWWVGAIVAVAVAIVAVAAIGFIIFVTNSERRIPIQYAKRVVGRKMYGGQSTHLPIKVNMSGVLPVIFAQAIASIPATIGMFVPAAQTEGTGWYNFLKAFDSTSLIYCIIYGLLIVMFSYFYNTIQFNPVEVSNNLKKNGGFVPGFRPGKPTGDFLQKVTSRITLFGALYLAVIALLPAITGNIMKAFGSSAGSGLAIGGTSVIIVVGVALETVKTLEAQMMMRHYKGFLD